MARIYGSFGPSGEQVRVCSQDARALLLPRHPDSLHGMLKEEFSSMCDDNLLNEAANTEFWLAEELSVGTIHILNPYGTVAFKSSFSQQTAESHPEASAMALQALTSLAGRNALFMLMCFIALRGQSHVTSLPGRRRKTD